MKTYDQRTPNIGDVVMLKSDEFYGKENRHYFVVTEVLNYRQVVCLSGNSQNPIKVDKSTLLQMEIVDKPVMDMSMKKSLPCYENFL